jgi:hypothetical protein
VLVLTSVLWFWKCVLRLEGASIFDAASTCLGATLISAQQPLHGCRLAILEARHALGCGGPVTPCVAGLGQVAAAANFPGAVAVRWQHVRTTTSPQISFGTKRANTTAKEPPAGAQVLQEACAQV